MDGFLTEKLEVDIVSNSHFNVIANLEGVNMRNFRYIQERSHCKCSVHQEDDSLYVLIIGENQEDLTNAKESCLELIEAVRRMKERHARQKAEKKAKKKKYGNLLSSIPDGFISAMKVYFPGEISEPPPPGSTADAKLHRHNFRTVAKREKWI